MQKLVATRLIPSQGPRATSNSGLGYNESPSDPRRLPESSPPSPGGSSSASDHRASRLSAAALSRTGSVACYAAGVLLAAFAALVALPSQAQAQTEVWSGTLTVRDLGFSDHGCSNTVSDSHCSARLTDDDFTHDSTDYAINRLFLRSNGQLELEFDTDLTTATQGLTLNVDGTAFAFEDADSKRAAARVWFSSGVSWSAGDSVSLTLIEPADATLSNLVLEDNAGIEINLTPTFVTGTTRYTASVASSVSAITLTPTVNDASATVEYLNASNAAITDTDTTTPALDAPLVVGANTFKVKVTAGNTTPTTETYRVVVTRAADTTPPSPESALVSAAGDRVTFSFDEDLDIAVEFLPAAVVAAFTVTADGADLDIDRIASGGSNLLVIILPTGTTIYQNQTVKVSYDKTAAGTDALEDDAGNEVATFTDFAVTNNSTVVEIVGAISIADASAAGNAGHLLFEVTLSRSFRNTVKVDFKTISGGTATAGEDYYARRTYTHVILAGDRTAQMGFALIEDAIDDAGETVKARLSNARLVDAYGDKIGDLDITRDEATGTITAPATTTTNVPGLTIGIQDATGDEDDRWLLFKVKLSRKSDDLVCYDFEAISGGTATEGTDYHKIPKATYWMAIGKKVDKPFVLLIDDSVNDNGETVKVKISNAHLCNDASQTLAITRAEATEQSGTATRCRGPCWRVSGGRRRCMWSSMWRSGFRHHASRASGAASGAASCGRGWSATSRSTS